MLILGIETSCDETGVALYDSRSGAARWHTPCIRRSPCTRPTAGWCPSSPRATTSGALLPLTRQVLGQAERNIDDRRRSAIRQGPGLAGALLVGASFAHGLGLALRIPALGIHHLEGHLLSPLLSARPPRFPFVALLVSGGHTQLMRVEGVGRYALLGETQDDAAGEAFDKTAQLLGLGYPGGPALSRSPRRAVPGRVRLPRPMLAQRDLDFSFSGLKTAV